MASQPQIWGMLHNNVSLLSKFSFRALQVGAPRFIFLSRPSQLRIADTAFFHTTTVSSASPYKLVETEDPKAREEREAKLKKKLDRLNQSKLNRVLQNEPWLRQQFQWREQSKLANLSHNPKYKGDTTPILVTDNQSPSISTSSSTSTSTSTSPESMTVAEALLSEQSKRTSPSFSNPSEFSPFTAFTAVEDKIEDQSTTTQTSPELSKRKQFKQTPVDQRLLNYIELHQLGKRPFIRPSKYAPDNSSAPPKLSRLQSQFRRTRPLVLPPISPSAPANKVRSYCSIDIDYLKLTLYLIFFLEKGVLPKELGCCGSYRQ
jgi:hypothetical protein